VTSLCRPLGAQRGRPAAPPCLASRPRALQTAGGERAQAGPFDAQDARLILSPPQPALAECLIPPSAALAFEPRERGGDAGAGAAAWDLGNGRLGVRARRLLLGAHVAGPEPPGIAVHRIPCFCWLLMTQHLYMSDKWAQAGHPSVTALDVTQCSGAGQRACSASAGDMPPGCISNLRALGRVPLCTCSTRGAAGRDGAAAPGGAGGRAEGGGAEPALGPVPPGGRRALRQRHGGAAAEGGRRRRGARGAGRRRGLRPQDAARRRRAGGRRGPWRAGRGAGLGRGGGRGVRARAGRPAEPAGRRRRRRRSVQPGALPARGAVAPP